MSDSVLPEGTTHSPEPDSQCADTLEAQANELVKNGKHAEAEPLFQECLRLRQELLGSNHLLTATTWTSLAAVCLALRRYEEAERFLLPALRIRHNQLGARHSDVADLLFGLAAIAAARERYEDAERLGTKAVDILLDGPESDNSALVHQFFFLGYVYLELHRGARSAFWYEKALALNDTLPEPDLDKKRMILNNIAATHIQRGTYRSAEPLLRQALAMSTSIEDNGLILFHLAVTCQKLKNDTEAEARFLVALPRLEVALGEDCWQVLVGMDLLGEVYWRQNRLTEMENLFQTLAVRQERAKGAKHPDTADAWHVLGVICHKNKRLEEAEGWYKKALSVRRELLGDSNAETQKTIRELTDVYRLIEEDLKKQAAQR